MTNNLSPKKILIVDDVSVNIKILSEILVPFYNISFATNGKRAIELATGNNPPDLILLDIMMPVMDGYEVCSILQSDKKTKDTPVIFITGKNKEEDEIKGFALGAVDYITKPFREEIVKARVNTHIELKKHRDFIKKNFCRYLTDEIVECILEQPEGISLGGKKETISLIMSDLRGFSNICEQESPEHVVSLLNAYLEKMTDIIFRYNGTLDEIIGDAILVIFGAPIKRTDDPQRAVACAIEMQRALSELNEDNATKGLPKLEMGIGIHTGEVIVGNIGSSKRTKYGIVGHNVNLAARIESFAIGGQIFVSENTLDACGPILHIADAIAVNPKGVKEPIKIFEISGIGGEFNLFLPEKKEEKLFELSTPALLQIFLLEGKYPTGQVIKGRLLKIGENNAVAEINSPIETFSNLRISLYDAQGNELTDDIYAKVTHTFPGSKHTIKINFTFTPPIIKKLLTDCEL